MIVAIIMLVTSACSSDFRLQSFEPFNSLLCRRMGTKQVRKLYMFTAERIDNKHMCRLLLCSTQGLSRSITFKLPQSFENY